MERALNAVPETIASDSAADLQKRLTGYGVTALAITSAIATSSGAAHASVVVYTPTTPLTASLNGPGILFDFATGMSGLGAGSVATPQFALYAGTTHHSFKSISGAHTVHFSSHVATVIPVQASALVAATVQPSIFGPAFIADNVSFAQPIDGTHERFSAASVGLAAKIEVSYAGFKLGTSYLGQFVPSPAFPANGVLGLAFALPDGEHFGWASITVDPGYDVTLNSFGYETNVLTSIAAPAVAPEATPLTLLLIGGPVALAAYRKLRRKDESSAMLA